MKLDPELIEEILRMQRAYESQKGVRGALGAGEPVVRILGKAVPEGLVKDGLARADEMAARTAPAWLSDHDTGDFDACQSAASRVRRQAVVGASASGVVSGLTGVVGLSADMAVSFAVAARTIRLTAMAYGYGGDDPFDRALRAHALDLAVQGAGSARSDKARMIREMLNGRTGAATVPVATAVIEDVALRAGRLLLQRFGGTAAARVVPLASSVVGGVVNWRLQTATAAAADYTYRQRWLADRLTLPMPEPEDAR